MMDSIFWLRLGGAAWLYLDRTVAADGRESWIFILPLSSGPSRIRS